MAPPWGLSTPRAPKKNKKNEFKKRSWSRNSIYYGFASYFACAKLYTFPMVSACALAP